MTYQNSLTALVDPTRRQILEQLRRGPRSVGQLAAGLPVSRPAVSQNLRILKEAHLVSEKREGTRRIYTVEPDGLADLRAYLEEFWQDVLTSFKETAGKEAAESDLGGTDAH